MVHFVVWILLLVIGLGDLIVAFGHLLIAFHVRPDLAVPLALPEGQLQHSSDEGTARLTGFLSNQLVALSGRTWCSMADTAPESCRDTSVNP
jgi:hypothetical protein